MSFFKSSIFVTIVGLAFAFWIGWHPDQSLTNGLNTLFFAAILAVLEVSLSFDNAVVNAKIMQQMSPEWQHRFLTWGMAIAVFGVRFLLPILIVSIAGHLSPGESLRLALTKPQEYAALMTTAHLSVTGFGASFLLAVALKYFFDENKDVHWIRWLEEPLVRLGRLEAFELAVTLLVMYGISRQLPNDEEQLKFLVASIAGLVTFILVDGFSAYFSTRQTASAGLSLFLYLEVLDASFSVDGVIGAFAITYDLLVIVSGLMIGAMFVRSLTVYMVAKQTLNKLVYLEHGAFYALMALALLMLLNVLHPVPEYITGLVGAFFIGLSVISSIRKARA